MFLKSQKQSSHNHYPHHHQNEGRLGSYKVSQPRWSWSDRRPRWLDFIRIYEAGLAINCSGRSTPRNSGSTTNGLIFLVDMTFFKLLDTYQGGPYIAFIPVFSVVSPKNIHKEEIFYIGGGTLGENLLKILVD